MCKESRVVLWSPENTTHDIFAKTGSYSPQNINYRCWQINTSKSRRLYHENCLLIKSFNVKVVSKTTKMLLQRKLLAFVVLSGKKYLIFMLFKVRK